MFCYLSPLNSVKIGALILAGNETAVDTDLHLRINNW
jgi:hypothetical protein